MKTITKGLVGTVAAGAMVLSATPAFARDGRDNGIDAGDVIAGALIIGGIAAVASAVGNDNDRYDDRYGGRYDDRYGGRYDDRYGYGGYDRDGYGRDDYGYGGRVSARQAIEMCVRAAERQASRYSYGGRADVTDIRYVDRTGNGFRVKGRIAVNANGRDWRRGESRYGRGWGGDYRGWNNGLSGYDSGSFTCKVRYGRVSDIDFSGIRGLR